MKKFFVALALSLTCNGLFAQRIEVSEFTLKNGLEVILHKDNTAPEVSVSVCYKVGSSNEDSTSVGFVHFFENVLYDNSHNIAKREFYSVLEKNYGDIKVKKNIDKTYFSEVFPSNKLKLALWLESGRMQKAIIDTSELITAIKEFDQNTMVEHKNFELRYVLEETSRRMFKKHPYRWMSFNSNEYIEKSKTKELIEFYNKYYTPNNAILTIAGDINLDSTKTWVKKYFEHLKKGPSINEELEDEPYLSQSISDSIYVKHPRKVISVAYRTPGVKDIDSKVVNVIEKILSDKIKESKLEFSNFQILNIQGYDIGKFIVVFEQSNEFNSAELLDGLDIIIEEIQAQLISQRDFEKEINQKELDFINKNLSMVELAENLSDYKMYFNNVGMINEEISIYRNIRKNDLSRVSKKYLNPSQRVILHFVPQR